MTTPQTFDPYRDWLGISDTNRPLDHYQLLRLKRFEDDPAKIRENYHKLYGHVRKQLQGKAAHLAHKVLGDLTKAMLCLTDASRKAEYDGSLGRTTVSEKKVGSFDDILVARKIVDREQLVKARKFSHVTGIELHDAIVQQKLASAEVVMQARAEALGVPYIDVAETTIDPELIAKLPAVLARQHTILPLVIEHDRVMIAAANPLSPAIEDEVRLRTGLAARLALCAPAKLHEAVNKFYSREAAAAEMGVTSQNATAAEEQTQVYGDPVERAKRRKQITQVAAMLTFAAIAIGANFIWTLDFPMGMIKVWLAGGAAAGVAAGIAWKVT